VLPRGGKLTRPTKGLITVAFAISRGTTWIDWVGPQAVFETWHRDPVTKKPAPRFQLFTVSEKKEPVDSLIPDHSFASAPPVNLVVVPAQRGSPALLRWLQKVQETADVTMSVCTGARHLAKAGLLDGRQATSHHGAIDQFAKDFPKVHWVRGVRFVEGEKIATGGGLTAGIDLALRVVERYFGRPATQQVADHLEYQGTGWKV
jgi:transcriptional regulator GlxA family with amidase domain